MRSVRIPVVALLLALSACGGGDRQGGVGGSPLLTPVEAEGRDGTVAVQGFLWARPDNDIFRLCEAVLESFPPQCGEPAVELTDVDVTGIAGIDFSQNIFWAEQVRARGQLAGGTLSVEAIELNTKDPDTGLTFRMLLPVEMQAGSGEFVALVTNSSPLAAVLKFADGQSADLTLAEPEAGVIVYRWGAGRTFDQAARELSLEPGETLRFPLRDQDFDLEPGVFDLSGTLTATPALVVRGRAVVR